MQDSNIKKWDLTKLKKTSSSFFVNAMIFFKIKEEKT